jgi:fermentation-respiration switch protein FrsA (DUF1100 family)
VSIVAPDGVRLHAWFLPAKGKAAGTILFLHGNAENISTHLASVHWLPARGFNVLLLDYRGYGRSEGTPTLPGVMADIESALGVLAARPDVDPQRIVVFGQSLGGSLAIYHVAHSAHRPRIRALVVESAFTGYRDIVSEKLASFWLTWPFQWLPSLTVDDEYSPAPVIAKIHPIPLLLIHGDRDVIVPSHHGERLYALAGEPKEFWLVPGAAHIETLRRPEYRDRFVDYLGRVLDGNVTAGRATPRP